MMDPDSLNRVFISLPKEDSTAIGALIGRSGVTAAGQTVRQLAQSQKLATIGLLISGIAHETCNLNNCIIFNTPILREYLVEALSAIEMYAEQQEDLELSGMPYHEFREDVFRILDSIEHVSNRMTETFSGLKEFVRLHSAQKQHCTDVREVIDKAVAICRGQIKKTVRYFEVNVAEDLPPIYMDPAALEQVLVNLLINAGQAVDKEDSWVMLRARQANSSQDRLVVEVSDNGCGMNEETKLKIFEPFFTTKHDASGSGLGLFVSKNLLEGFGGQIEVESNPGMGSTFRVLLKRAGSPL